MAKLGRVHVASFDTGIITSAGDYPAAADRITLPAGAVILRATLVEKTTIAGLTNVQLKAGSSALMSVLALSDIDAYEPLTLTGNQVLGAPAALVLTTTGTASGDSQALVHVEYIMSEDLS